MKHTTATSPIYLEIRDRIIAGITSGVFPNNSYIPTERDLAAKFKVSRKTIRSALQALEEQGVLTRVQGRGTQITYNTGGVSASMDLVALVASAQSPFFSEFYRHFEEEAEQHDSLVVFKEDSQGRLFKTESLLNKFFSRGIRNLVIWPYNFSIDPRMVALARGLGMNLVFFDEDTASPNADAVLLDNRNAMTRLCNDMLRKGLDKNNVVFATYSDVDLNTAIERKTVFTEKIGGRCLGIPFASSAFDKIEPLVRKLMASPPRGIICVNGQLALALRQALQQRGLSQDDISISCIDNLPGMSRLGITRIAQPMKDYARLAWELLSKQSTNGRNWKANVYRLKGKLLKP